MFFGVFLSLGLIIKNIMFLTFVGKHMKTPKDAVWIRPFVRKSPSLFIAQP